MDFQGGLSGSRKAAAFLMAVGPEAASDILKHLDEETVLKVSAEMMKIQQLSPEDQDELIGDFILQLKKIKSNSFGGEFAAKKILTDAFGEDKAKKVFNRIDQFKIDEKFSFLNNIDVEVIIMLVDGEHPQTIAVMLTQLEPDKSAGIMKNLPADVTVDVAKRIAKMGNISPEAVVAVSTSMKKKYENFLEKQGRFNTAGGVDALVNIMNHLNGETESRILKEFNSNMPDYADEINSRIYTFDNVLTLTNQEVRILIDEIDDDRELAVALKGAGDDIRFKFLRNMSNNRATDIIESMDLMGPVKISEIEETRHRIVALMRSLNDNGVIIIRKENEKYVE